MILMMTITLIQILKQIKPKISLYQLQLVLTGDSRVQYLQSKTKENVLDATALLQLQQLRARTR